MFPSQLPYSQPSATSSSGTATAAKTSLKWKVLSRLAFNLHCDYSYPLTLSNIAVCHVVLLHPLTCQICNRKHHTSLCQERNADELLIATGIPTTHVTYPVVTVEDEGIKCRALLDTGAGRSYASAALLGRASSGKRKKEVRKIEMLLGTSSR